MFSHSGVDKNSRLTTEYNSASRTNINAFTPQKTLSEHFGGSGQSKKKASII